MRTVEIEGKRLKLFINVVVLVVSLWGASKRDMTVHKTSLFENMMIGTFAPLQRSVSFIHGNISLFFENYVLNINASKENSQLRKKIDMLKRDLFINEEVERENKRLKDLLEFGSEIKRKKILARIVAWDTSTDFKVIRVNKGASNGVRLQSTVLTSKGLVGYVYRMTDHFADVLTILDSNNRVDSIIKRTRSHGVTEGHANDRCYMKYVNRIDPIILGDVVMTSGLGNVYPKGIKVGIVGKIERESFGITQDVEIIPAVDLRKLEEVVILSAENDQGQKLKEWKALDEYTGDDR